jgi:hypothetical protein
MLDGITGISICNHRGSGSHGCCERHPGSYRPRRCSCCTNNKADTLYGDALGKVSRLVDVPNLDGGKIWSPDHGANRLSVRRMLLHEMRHILIFFRLTGFLGLWRSRPIHAGRSRRSVRSRPIDSEAPCHSRYFLVLSRRISFPPNNHKPRSNPMHTRVSFLELGAARNHHTQSRQLATAIHARLVHFLNMTIQQAAEFAGLGAKRWIDLE